MSKHKTLTADEFNNLIDILNESNTKYEIKKDCLSVAIKDGNFYYECFLTKPDSIKPYNVGAINSSFMSKCKIDILKDSYGYKEEKGKVSWKYRVACGFKYANDYWAKKDLICWSYDINSAYAYAMLKPMPDTTVEPRYNDIIKEGEIGFYPLGGASTEVGEFANIIFPLMESPFKNYIIEYYNLKQKAKGIERKKWKDFLNFPSGFLAKKNIFLRNALIYYSNEYINQFIDENTVYVNVDCIVSLVPRYDIPIGNEIGQFKEEHKAKKFYYIKPMIYQWEDEKGHCPGIPSESIQDIKHIEDWRYQLYYKFENGKVVKNEKYKEEN